MDIDSRIKAYKFVAYSAVTFSVIAVLSVCVTLPMVYNYVQHVKTQMTHEMKFCKVGRKIVAVRFVSISIFGLLFSRDLPKIYGQRLVI